MDLPRFAASTLASFLFFLSFLGFSATSAAATPQPPTGGDEERDLEWDWLQMKSGEWLKGEFILLEDETVYFDSDEFDEQELDWDDVATLISAGPHLFRFEGEDPIKGTFEMRDGVIRIDTGDSIREAPSSHVLAMVPGEGRELDYWHADASISFSARAGNTDQTDLGTRIEILRRTTRTRFRTKYLANISKLDGETTAQNYSVPSSFDYFLTHRLFINVVSLNYDSDIFQNLDRRLTVGAGAGYEFYSNKWVTVEARGGLAFQNTAFVEVVSGDETAKDAAVTSGAEIDFDLPHGVEWDNLYQVQIVVTDMDKTSHHAESILSLDFWGPLDIDLSLIFDRIEQPAPTSTGVPESNDYRMTVGLALDL